MNSPLADRIRPQALEDVVGQQHLLNTGKVLRRIIDNGRIPNMIFYGPSGTGKTTVANIIAGMTKRSLYRLNATTASVSDIRAIIDDLDKLAAQNGALLYLDEIQNFNKKQQQSLLEYIENGKITLIAATTENPYFYIYNAILSRSTVFEFKPLVPDDIAKALERAIKVLAQDYGGIQINADSEAVLHLAHSCGGDVRKAINSLEVCAMSAVPEDGIIHITVQIAAEATQKMAMRYDRDGDSHYDVLSAFQKSIRGSDPDAGVHYLARLVEAGDLQSICRRLLVIAAEDIGLAYPSAISITKSCVDAALQLGLPEARIPLSEAVLLLCACPKSNSAIMAIDSATEELQRLGVGDIPAHLKDSHYSGAKKLSHGTDYKYPHSFPNNYVKQQYLPDNIKNSQYYNPGSNKFEQGLSDFLKKLRGE